jgi:DNA-binding XRE family transcriptional regulator
LRVRRRASFVGVDDLAQQLADTLKRLRREADLTQTEMAKRLGISQSTLARLEVADQNTTLKTLGTLCRSLRCDLNDLFKGKAKLRR